MKFEMGRGGVVRITVEGLNRDLVAGLELNVVADSMDYDDFSGNFFRLKYFLRQIL